MRKADNRGTILIDRIIFVTALHRIGFGEVDRRIGEILQHRIRTFTFNRAIVVIDRVENILPWRYDDFDFAIENEPQLVKRVQIERIGDDHLEAAIFFRHRQDDIFAGDRFGNQLDHRRGDGHLIEIDEIEVVFFGDRLHHLIASRVA